MTAVVQALTPEEVDAGLDEIRGWLGEYPEATVIRLYEGRAWLAKGYPDWDALMAAEIPSRVQLPRPERREVVGRLRAEGLSTRAIASAVGVDHSTVVRDITATGASAPVERPDTVTGLDGKTRKAHVTTTTRTTEATKVEHDIDVATGEILPGPGLPDPVEESRPITSEQWQAENPDLGQMLAADPEVRAANLRRDLSRWMVELTKPYLFPAEEMAAIAPDKADRIAELMDGMNQWHDTYRAALRRSRMTVVGGGQR